MSALRLVLFVVGYPTAIVVITRWVSVVRERRATWFAVHTAAVTAIVIGWLLAEAWSAAVINQAWLQVSVAWYMIGGRRPVSRRQPI